MHMSRGDPALERRKAQCPTPLLLLSSVYCMRFMCCASVSRAECPGTQSRSVRPGF